MDVLAAGVDRVVIVRRQRERKGPVEAVLDGRRRRANRDLGPDLDSAALPRPFVESFDRASQASKAGAGCPDDVVVDRTGTRPAALPAGHRVPHAARNRTAFSGLALLRNATVAR